MVYDFNLGFQKQKLFFLDTRAKFSLTPGSSVKKILLSTQSTKFVLETPNAVF